jgi:hypothetical protein
MEVRKLKIGITKAKNPNKNDSGEVFYYTMWFRTADGVLRDINLTKSCDIHSMVEAIGEAEGVMKLHETKQETTRETFLNQI